MRFSGTSLHQELFYKIHCKQEPGYCLFVSNCTVSAGSEPPYEIIDRQGCTTEPSLFEHVRVSVHDHDQHLVPLLLRDSPFQYLDDFTGGIFNPLPVRFRNQQSAVRFQCATKLQLREQGGHCERPACTHNDYSPDANFHVHDH